MQKWVSMAEALAPFGWDPADRVVSNYSHGGDPSKRGERTADQPSATVTSKVDRNVVYRNNLMPNQAQRHLDQPAPTLSFGHNLPEWCHKRPSTTVVGTFKPEVIAAPGYRTTVSRQNQPDSVRVTVHEAGVLQSFPADYPWQGAKGKQFLQCGNAIPPLLAEAVLCAALGQPFIPAGATEASSAPIGEAGVVLRNNNTANAAVRQVETPAPTLYFGQRCNYVAWERA